MCFFLLQPERIDPTGNISQYDIRSDVWSFGISMIELATGKFPYQKWGTPFEQLKQVVTDDPPRLPAGEFTPEFEDFIAKCLQKKCSDRYNYSQLLNHPFCLLHKDKETDVASYVSEILDLPENL